MRSGGDNGPDAAAPVGEGEGGGSAGQNSVSSLADIPAVRTYLKRIGAEPRSMTTAAKREHVGRYWRDLAVIRLDKNTGAITVQSPDGGNEAEFAPTEIEAAQIAAESADVSWPSLQPLHAVIDPPEQVRKAAPGDVFEFRGPDGTIQMLQVRIEKKDGGKSYIPFTYWSDGQWRCIEPDGPLPLWGADQLKGRSAVWLHEGAKAACAVTEMLADPEKLAACPWGQDFTYAAHCGWIGGALSPHRTDWSVLSQHGITRVYIAADNDPEGQSAIPKISKLLASYPIAVIAVRPDERFPPGFDHGDPFPPNLFHKTADGRDVYHGPSCRECMGPGTWATWLGTPREADGKPPVFLRKEFAQEWHMVAGEGDAIFINRFDRTRLLSESAFNTAVRPFSDTPRTADLFKQSAYPQHVKAIAYEPGDKEGVITIEGDRCINTWTSPRVQPANGDPQPWLDFMEHLFPQGEDRLEVMRWCATLIACPRVRMLYGLMLSSAMQGVGKTTLCEILRVQVGEKNCSSPSAKSVVDGQFNSWIVRKRLVFVNEIYEGSKWTAYNKLKSSVTDLTLEANEKYLRAYSVRNWAHFILCSNAEVPLWIEDDDRRFLVPEVTELRRSEEDWTRFYAWLAGGGHGVIAAWAKQFVKDHGAVKAGAHAPDSARKRSLIEDSRSSEEMMVRSLADAAKERGCQVVLVENEVATWLEDKSGRHFKPATVRGWLRKAGLCVSKERLKVGGQMTRVAGVLPVDTADGWSALQPHRVKPEDLEAM